MTINLSELTPVQKQEHLQYIIAPRPIGFVSSINKVGQVNLSPFSFFNLFSSEPPVVIFSVSRRVRDNSVKHTLLNVKEVPEVVINMVSYDMVHQASLASGDYPRDVDEFVKAGFAKEHAKLVRPPMVKESPAKLECKVLQVQSLGENGGAGQLVIAEVCCLHIENLNNLDLVARMGGNWYTRMNTGRFEVQKPRHAGIGMEQLPEFVRATSLLTNNQKAQLAGVESLPVRDPDFDDDRLDAIHTYTKNDRKVEILFSYAKELLEENKTAAAWQVLLSS